MNPVVLAGLPLAMAPILFLLHHRGTLTVGLSAATSLLWTALCLAMPLVTAVEVLGRPIVLSRLDRLALALLGLQAVLLTVTEWASEREVNLAPIVLLMLGTTAAALMASHLGVAALMLSLAAVVAVFSVTSYAGDAMSGRVYGLTQWAPGYLTLMIIAALLLVAAAWFGDLTALQADVTIGTRPAAILATIGLGILLAVPPFHSWWVVTVMHGSAALAAFLGTMLPTAGLLLLAEFVQANPWVAAEDSLARSLTAAGLLAAVVGGFLGAGANDLRRWQAYSTIVGTGCMLAGLGTMTVTGMTGAVVLLLNHGISLALVTACRETVVKSDRVVVLGWLIGGLSLSGIPLTAGFVGRWLVYRPLFQQSAISSALLILSSFGLFVGHLRTWHGIAMQPRLSLRTGRAVFLKLLVVGSVVTLVVLGMTSSIVLPTIVEALRGLTFLSP